MSNSPIVRQEEFREERRHTLGGSDVGGLYNLPPYGCTLRLSKQKRGDKPDVPFYGNAATARGQRWERIAAEIYGERTNREVRKASPKADAVVSRLRPQPDFEIINNARGPEMGRGILSVKVPGAEMFRRLKAAILVYKELKNPKTDWEKKLVEDGKAALFPYELQLQAEMGAQKVLWGDYALLWLDGDDMVSLGYQDADKVIIDDIRARAKSFWDAFDAGKEPPKLDPESKQCKHCEFRLSCQSSLYSDALNKEANPEQIVLLSGLEKLVVEYRELLAIIDEAEEHKKLSAEGIKAYMGQWSIAEDGNIRVYTSLMPGRNSIQTEPLTKHLKGLAEDAEAVIKAFTSAQNEDELLGAIRQSKPLLKYVVSLPEDLASKFTKKGKPYPQLRVYDIQKPKTQPAVETAADNKALSK